MAALALLTWSRLGGGARAAEAEGDRVVVELAVSDALPLEQARTLRSLLESQLSTHALTLRLEHPGADLRRWLSGRSDDALLRVALDVPEVDEWRLLLVDATRGRAVARALTGGVRRDRAAIEAVCDIVVSAAVALREGLEVASQTVDEALTGAAPRGGSAPPPTAVAPAGVSASEPSPRASAPLRLQAGAGPAVATFARAAPASWGAAAELSVWRGDAGLELLAARYLGQTVTSSEGSFTLDRTWVGLSVAAAARWRRARLSGNLGMLCEILQRGEASPAAATVSSTPPDASTRLGPQAGASAAVALSRRVAITWGLGLGYLLRRVRYLAGAGSDAALAEPWPLAGVSMLRVDVTLP